MSDVSERAEAMLAKITERGRGWEVRHEHGELTRVVHSGEWEGSLSQCCDCGVEAGYPNDADAEFIAAAPDLVRDLLAEVKRLESQHASYKTFISECGSDEGAYCEGWAHGYEASRWRMHKYLDEHGIESVDALVGALQAKIDAVRSALWDTDGYMDHEVVAFAREALGEP